MLACYANDHATTEMIAKMSINSEAVPGFTLCDGVLRYGGRIWIGDNVALQQRILQAVHSSVLGSHSGFPNIYQHLKQMFYWRGMKSAIRDFVSACLTYQQAKPDRSRLPGLLQLLLGR
jgi:hypothetical protein